jgi:hypothetical protein
MLHHVMSPVVEDPGAQSPERDIPSLFGALGLVKKAKRMGHGKHYGKVTQAAGEDSFAETG